MSEITLFENPQFGKVRVIMRGSDLWFVGSDVATCLGYTDPKRAVCDHCEEAQPYAAFGESENIGGVKTTPPMDSQLPKICSPLDPQTKLIPESDVYRLAMRSKLPTAEVFQDWVVEDVIPSIRNTGSYSQTPTSYLDALKQCVALEEARLAAEAEKQKAQAGIYNLQGIPSSSNVKVGQGIYIIEGKKTIVK